MYPVTPQLYVLRVSMGRVMKAAILDVAVFGFVLDG